MDDFVLYNNDETKNMLSRETGLSVKQIETWIYNSRKTKWYKNRKIFLGK
jgi:hypothetical protein